MDFMTLDLDFVVDPYAVDQSTSLHDLMAENGVCRASEKGEHWKALRRENQRKAATAKHIRRSHGA